MRRREFIAGLGSAAVWPVVARAQQSESIRRIGVLMGPDASDPEARAYLSGFTEALSKLGWSDRNVRIDTRWGAGNHDRMQALAKELVDSQPDVILAFTTPATAALRRETQTTPIVFVGPSDPIGDGFVASLPRPGGNLTGFTNLEASMAGKWLQLLTEIVPSIKRVAIMYNPETAPGRGLYFLTSFEAAARLLKIEPIAAPFRSEAEIDTVMTSLGRELGDGLIVTSDNSTFVHRAAIIQLAARKRIPAVYALSIFVREGGLISYGQDQGDIFRRAAPYVDRILRGAQPADLPVQQPVKFNMAINVRTAKTLGLAVPQSILLSADEVIE